MDHKENNEESNKKIEIIESPKSEDNEFGIELDNSHKGNKNIGEIREIELNRLNSNYSKIENNQMKSINLERIESLDENIMEENFQTEKKVVCSFFFLYLISIFANIIISLVLAINLTYDINDLELNYYKKIGNNWSLNLISGININECAEDKNLLKDYWPGEKEGCDCGNGNVIIECPMENSTVCRGEIIPEKKPIKYKLWRGEKICTNSEYEDSTYFDLDIRENSGDCGEDKKNCGIIDTYKNILCVEKTKNCPIVNIRIVEKEIRYLSNDKIIELKNFNIISNNNHNDFPNSYIPVEFKISENKPCLNPYYKDFNYSLSPLNKYYQKNKCKKYSTDNLNNTSNNSYFDYDFRELDTIDKKVFFDENKIKENFPKGEKITLFHKPYIGMNIECHKKYKKENKGKDLIKKILDIEVKEYSTNNAVFFNIISLFLSTFLCLRFFETVQIFFSSIILRRKDNEEGTKFILIGYSFLAFGLSIGIIISLYNFQNNFLCQSLIDLFEDNCFDSFTSDITKKHNIIVKDLEKALRIALGFSWIFLYLILGYLFILTCSIFKSLD